MSRLVFLIGAHQARVNGYNLKDADEVKEYLKNLHIEYQFGCLNEKRPDVCHLLGDYNDAIKQDYNEAAKIYKDNCDTRNYNKSCTKYGEYSFAGRGCEKNIQEAFKYMRKGCELNDPKGCLDAGAFAVSDEKLEKSRDTQVSLGIQMLRKACDANEERACFYLSGIFLKGIEGFVEKNMKEAYVFSLKCCEAGNPYACANVSMMHKNGDGVQKNEEMAKAFKTRSTELLKDIREAKRQLKFQQGINP
ncbi:cytochrome c oxidase assembly factor 7 isoform X1 [Osmia lignaria lignaria]|uniref:cytochrome c oxidase assembly factor 7 isoform X1 n=1 Tax=Osmia lignaria lignaria TaxID=1437193 RepID=UPI00147918EB|nr:cytochrome c oxidase assembly factor 7 homolog isoform X1 [Osmia lignaria]